MKKAKILMKRTILLFLILIVTYGLSAYIYHEMLEAEEDICWQTLSDTADTVSDSIETQINNNINILRLASGAMVQEGRVESYDAITTHINAFQHMTIFTRIDMLYADSTLLVQNGETMTLSDKTLFETVLTSMKNGVYFSERREDIFTGEPVILCAVPVMQEDTPVAVMVGVINCLELPEQFDTQAYGGDAFVCLVNSSDGDFIMDNWHDKLGNMYKMKNRKTLPEYEGMDLKEEIKNRNTGVIAYVSAVNGVASYMYFTPVEVGSWELLIVAQENVIFSGAEQLRHYLVIFGVIETILLILYMLWGGYSTYQVLKAKDVLEQQLRISNTLNKCTRELAMHTELDQAIDSLLKIINEYFTGDRTYLFRIDYKEEIVENIYEYATEGVCPQIENLKKVPLEAVQPWIEMFRQKGSFFISDIDKDVNGKTITYELLAQQDIHSLLAVPLCRQDQIVGFLGVDNPKTNSSPELLESIQFFIMDTLERKEQGMLLEKMSVMDGLTGLYNRNKFNLFLQECTELQIKNIGVAYFDLNGLKRVNDASGHEAGDQFIVSTADIIEQVFPKSTYRIGGDEFVVLYPDIPEAAFGSMIKLVKEQLTAKNLSVSCGMAYCEESQELEQRMKDADHNMYVDKKQYYETHERRR